jgi:hypothetical protein
VGEELASTTTCTLETRGLASDIEIISFLLLGIGDDPRRETVVKGMEGVLLISLTLSY